MDQLAEVKGQKQERKGSTEQTHQDQIICKASDDSSRFFLQSCKQQMSKLADPRSLQPQRPKHFAAMSPPSILKAADVCAKLFLANDLLRSC